MDYLSYIASSIAGSTGSQIVKSTLNQLEDSEDSMTVDQMVSVGLLKSQKELFPRGSDRSDAIADFAQDYETLRYAGISNRTAFEIARLIYLPRTYLLKKQLLPKEFVLNLDEHGIETIVDNSLSDFLQTNNVSTDTDLEFNIAGLEGDKPASEVL